MRVVFQAMILLAMYSHVTLAQTPAFLRQWGSKGSGPGQFLGAIGIAVSQDGRVYVSDYGNNRIQVFTDEGIYQYEWGGIGNADGRMQGPEGIAISPSGEVYVNDLDNHRIQKFSASGQFLGKYTFPDTESCELAGIAVSSLGEIYAADAGPHRRMSRFTSLDQVPLYWGGPGTPPGGFTYPFGVAVGPDQTVYVTDLETQTIQRFDHDGHFLQSWGGYGDGDGSFLAPGGIAINRDNSVWVADYTKHCIQVFDNDGNFRARWGSFGSEAGYFNRPIGLAFDSQGQLYVIDRLNSRIQVFGEAPTPTSTITWGKIRALYR